MKKKAKDLVAGDRIVVTVKDSRRAFFPPSTVLTFKEIVSVSFNSDMCWIETNMGEGFEVLPPDYDALAEIHEALDLVDNDHRLASLKRAVKKIRQILGRGE